MEGGMVVCNDDDDYEEWRYEQYLAENKLKLTLGDN